MVGSASPELKSTIMEVVDNQLRSLNPPETKEAYDRLIEGGYSDEQAHQMIASVLVSEIYTVLKYKKKYNHKRYARQLKKLPELPWE